MGQWTRASEFLDQESRYDRMLAPFGDSLVASAAVAAGDRVVDVGCGTGATTLAVAERAARVVAVDIDYRLVGRAAERAQRAGVANVDFVVADAGAFAFAPSTFDVVVSRFALMLFERPVVALANLRRALRPGGRLAATVWQSAAVNAWHALPAVIVSEHAGVDCDLHGERGPFAYADPKMMRNHMQQAGFGNVRFEGLDERVWVGADADDVVAFFDEDAGSNLRSTLGEGGTRAVFDELRARVEAYATPDGVLVPAAAWLVTADV